MSQTRPDALRSRHAPRPADLQQGQPAGQLGTRLGGAVPDHRQPLLGSHQVFALPIACGLPQRQGLTKGKKGRSKPSKANPTIAPDPNSPANSFFWPPNGSPTTRSWSLATALTAARASSATRPPTSTSSATSTPKVALHDRAPIEKAPGRGAPRKKGRRLPGIAQLGQQTPPTPLD